MFRGGCLGRSCFCFHALAFPDTCSHGNVFNHAKVFAGHLPLHKLTLQVRGLLQHKGLYEYLAAATDEKKVAGNTPLRKLTLQVRDLLQHKGLHGYQAPDVAITRRQKGNTHIVRENSGSQDHAYTHTFVVVIF